MPNVRGRIKSLKKTYGFIIGEDGKDYFFYWSFLKKDNGNKTFNQLVLGNTVEFAPFLLKEEEGDKAVEKLQAKDITVVD